MKDSLLCCVVLGFCAFLTICRAVHDGAYKFHYIPVDGNKHNFTGQVGFNYYFWNLRGDDMYLRRPFLKDFCNREFPEIATTMSGYESIGWDSGYFRYEDQMFLRYEVILNLSMRSWDSDHRLARFVMKYPIRITNWQPGSEFLPQSDWRYWVGVKDVIWTWKNLEEQQHKFLSTDNTVCGIVANRLELVEMRRNISLNYYAELLKHDPDYNRAYRRTQEMLNIKYGDRWSFHTLKFDPYANETLGGLHHSLWEVVCNVCSTNILTSNVDFLARFFITHRIEGALWPMILQKSIVCKRSNYPPYTLFYSGFECALNESDLVLKLGVINARLTTKLTEARANGNQLHCDVFEEIIVTENRTECPQPSTHLQNALAHIRQPPAGLEPWKWADVSANSNSITNALQLGIRVHISRPTTTAPPTTTARPTVPATVMSQFVGFLNASDADDPGLISFLQLMGMMGTTAAPGTSSHHPMPITSTSTGQP